MTNNFPMSDHEAFWHASTNTPIPDDEPNDVFSVPNLVGSTVNVTTGKYQLYFDDGSIREVPIATYMYYTNGDRYDLYDLRVHAMKHGTIVRSPGSMI